MAYECKIYDSKGQLKKVVGPNEVKNELLSKALSQKSTQNYRKFIKNFEHGKEPKDSSQKFYEKNCLVCGKEFYCRRPFGKYCSHECQKRNYYQRNIAKRKKVSGSHSTKRKRC